MEKCFVRWNGSSRNHVSLGTFALALVLSPSLLQFQYTCERGDTYLRMLEFEVSGQNQIAAFGPDRRSYDVSTTSGTAILRTASRDPDSTVSYQWLDGGTSIASGVIGVGGGQTTLSIPSGKPTLRVNIRAPEGGLDHYSVYVNRTEFPCTEQGILDAIAVGGGPLTFDCDGPTVVTTTAKIIIDNDVILDGEGLLTIDAGGTHPVLSVAGGTVELRGLVFAGGQGPDNPFAGSGGIANIGNLTLIDSLVSGNRSFDGGGISTYLAKLTLIGSTVSGNTAFGELGLGGGIYVEDSLVKIVNSTVSGNHAWAGGGILDFGGSWLEIINSTISDNTADQSCGAIQVSTGIMISSTVSGNFNGGPEGSICHFWTGHPFQLANNLIEGECDDEGIVSSGGNVESPGDSCGLTDPSDVVNASSAQLALGPLQDNGGPTLTHAPLAGSVAIDLIAVEDCVDADGMPLTADQRGVARPRGTACDAGAVEVVP